MTTTALSIESGELAAPPPDVGGVRAYKGIPYAAPPVGPLRWRSPQPVAPWKGVRSADAFAPNSLQGVVFDDIDPTVCGVSEDCLYLNVWTPASPGSSDRLPVMVWIHGGGFVVGSGSEPRYDGTRLAKRGVLVVTLNHRLNALGFLAHPELTRESGHGASGNYGMLDLVAALRWVRRNIAVFGGDPDMVTIAGESAGSEAVSALMASPLAKGLFARAIGESGAMFATPSRSPAPLAKVEADGIAFMRKVGAANLKDLREAPAEAILEAAPGLGYRPIVDGRFLPKSPAAIFAAREQSDVPLMAGWNKDEGFNFTLLQGEAKNRPYAGLVREIFGARTDDALRFYPGGSPEAEEASARALGGDLTIIHSTWAWIEAQKTTGKAEVFRFRFDRAPLTPQRWFGDRDSKSAGAFHAGEILYVFDNLHAFPWLISDADRALARLASSYWVNFVKTGDPNGPNLPLWPSFRSGLVMKLDTPASAALEDGRERQVFLRDAAAQTQSAAFLRRSQGAGASSSRTS
ncbi:MAG: carboxylesterase/lipase family protein [Hyphomicrobiales bacterium]|nr:carboxylesterase/lipase family protein [Hyphomicrobiales bacterium]